MLSQLDLGLSHAQQEVQQSVAKYEQAKKLQWLAQRLVTGELPCGPEPSPDWYLARRAVRCLAPPSASGKT